VQPFVHTLDNTQFLICPRSFKFFKLPNASKKGGCDDFVVVTGRAETHGDEAVGKLIIESASPDSPVKSHFVDTVLGSNRAQDADDSILKIISESLGLRISLSELSRDCGLCIE